MAFVVRQVPGETGASDVDETLDIHGPDTDEPWTPVAAQGLCCQPATVVVERQPTDRPGVVGVQDVLRFQGGGVKSWMVPSTPPTARKRPPGAAATKTAAGSRLPIRSGDGQAADTATDVDRRQRGDLHQVAILQRPDLDPGGLFATGHQRARVGAPASWSIHGCPGSSASR